MTLRLHPCCTLPDTALRFFHVSSSSSSSSSSSYSSRLFVRARCNSEQRGCPPKKPTLHEQRRFNKTRRETTRQRTRNGKNDGRRIRRTNRGWWFICTAREREPRVNNGSFGSRENKVIIFIFKWKIAHRGIKRMERFDRNSKWNDVTTRIGEKRHAPPSGVKIQSVAAVFPMTRFPHQQKCQKKKKKNENDRD